MTNKSLLPLPVSWTVVPIILLIANTPGCGLRTANDQPVGAQERMEGESRDNGPGSPSPSNVETGNATDGRWHEATNASTPESEPIRLASKVLKPLTAPRLATIGAGEIPDVAELPARVASDSQRIDGKWFGIYYSYPRFYAVELELKQSTKKYRDEPHCAEMVPRLRHRPSSRDSEWIDQLYSPAAFKVHATARFHKLRNPEDQPRYAQKEDLVEFAVGELEGWIDPLLNTFSIRGVKWTTVEQPFSSQLRVTFTGVKSDSLEQLGGWFLNDQFFVATKDREVARKMTDWAIEAQRFHPPVSKPDTAGRGNANGNPARTGRLRGRRDSNAGDEDGSEDEAETLEKGLAWLDLFTTRIAPELSSRRTMGMHYDKAMSLYMSGNFNRHFGKPIEDLTWEDRGKWQRILQKASQGGYGSEARRRAKNFTLLNMFSTGSPGWAETVAAVWMNRVLRNWIAERIDRFEKTKSYEEMFDDVLIFKAICDALLSNAFIDERKAFVDRFSAIERRVATATLAAMAAAPDENDRFENWRLKQLYTAVGPEEAATAERTFSARVMAQQIALLQEEVDRIASIPDDENALRKTAGWKQRIEKRFSDLRQSKAWQQIASWMEKRRSRLLTEFHSNVTEQLAAAESLEEVREIAGWSLTDEKERNSKPGTVIAEAISTHLSRTYRLGRLAYYSKQEQDLMSADALTINVPPRDRIPVPTADSIRMAFLREMAKLPGCKRITPETVSYGWPGFRNLATFRVQVRKVRLMETPDMITEGRYAGAFRCKYQTEMSISRESGSIHDLLKGTPQGELLRKVDALTEAEARASTIMNAFELTSQGWRSPTLRKRGIQSIFHFR